jgi:glycosyltransferase involved in cell wall biosynthesis
MLEAGGDITLSVVVPVGARHANMARIYADYKAALERLPHPHEIIFVLDGRHPQVTADLEELQRRGEDFLVVSLTRAFGESTALMAGFERAHGTIVITLPSYYQIEPAEISKLIDALSSADVAIGRRWPRSGGRLESLRRGLFHGALRWLTGLRFNDLGCGARAMWRRVIEEVFLYGDQHRFLAVLAHRQGFRVVEVTVRQSPSDRFEGRYRLREYAHRVLDILTVLFLVRFTKKPLRFFGMIGLLTAGAGVAVLLYLLIARLGFAQPLADRPALLLASLLVVLGLQLFAIGLLGELIIFTHARDIKDYQVERVFRFADQPVQAPPAPLDPTQDRITAN